MKLSTLYTSVPEYIEFGWVTAPNAASQSISANTITTLTLDTEVADTGNLVSAPSSNEFTIPAGTYYFEAHAWVYSSNLSGGRFRHIFSLNKSDNSYISREETETSQDTLYGRMQLSGQFVLAAQEALKLRVLSSRNIDIGNATNPAFTDSTASGDQRTTIKLWKLK